MLIGCGWYRAEFCWRGVSDVLCRPGSSCHISRCVFILHDTWRKRFVGAGIFLASVVPWILVWSIRNLLAAGNATNRELVWHPITASNFDTTLSVISRFLVPVADWQKQFNKMPWLFIALAVLILLVVLVWISIKAWKYFVGPRKHLARRLYPSQPAYTSLDNCLHYRIDAAL